MIVVRRPEDVEARLADAVMRCPRCGGVLCQNGGTRGNAPCAPAADSRVEEAVHVVVGDVGEQGLCGGAGVERATGVGAGDERQAGGLFTHQVGEDDGVPDAHPDEDGATEDVGQLGHEAVIQ